MRDSPSYGPRPLIDRLCKRSLARNANQRSPLTSTLIDTRWAITPVGSRYMSSSMNFGALVHIFLRRYVPPMIAEFT